jgi:hypothetical protein
MGFNPFRPFRRTGFDVAMLVAALTVTIALLVWATRA